MFLQRMLLYNCKAFRWNLDSVNQKCSSGETWVRTSIWISFKKLLEIPDSQNSVAGNKNNNILIEWHVTNWKLLIKTSVEGVKPVFWRGRRIENGEFPKMWHFVSSLAVYQDSNAEKKPSNFQSDAFVKVKSFRLRPRWNVWTFNFWRKVSSNPKVIQY